MHSSRRDGQIPTQCYRPVITLECAATVLLELGILCHVPIVQAVPHMQLIVFAAMNFCQKSSSERIKMTD